METLPDKIIFCELSCESVNAVSNMVLKGEAAQTKQNKHGIKIPLIRTGGEME